MGKHDVPEDPPQSAPEWIVTFSDMISLLVTFFVMLMSFSTMEPANEAVIQSAFGENMGGIISNDSGSNAVPQPPSDRMAATHPLRGADRPHTRPPEETARESRRNGPEADRGAHRTRHVRGSRWAGDPLRRTRRLRARVGRGQPRAAAIARRARARARTLSPPHRCRGTHGRGVRSHADLPDEGGPVARAGRQRRARDDRGRRHGPRSVADRGCGLTRPDRIE